MPVGDRDLAVHRLAVAVLVGHRLVDLDPVLQLQLPGVAHRHQTVAGETQRTTVEMRAQGRVEARRHPRLDRLDRRRADGDVGLALRTRRADADQSERIDA